MANVLRELSELDVRRIRLEEAARRDGARNSVQRQYEAIERQRWMQLQNMTLNPLANSMDFSGAQLANALTPVTVTTAQGTALDSGYSYSYRATLGPMPANYTPYEGQPIYWATPQGFDAMPGGPPAAVAERVDAPSREMLVHEKVTVQNLDSPRAQLARDAEALLGYSGLRKHVKAPGRLRQGLAALEIEVLEEASVDRYKLQMVEHYATHRKMASPTWRLHPLRKYTQPVPEYVLQKAVEIKRELPEAEFYVDQLAVDPFLIVALGHLTDHLVNQSRKLDPDVAAYIEVWDEPKFES